MTELSAQRLPLINQPCLLKEGMGSRVKSAHICTWTGLELHKKDRWGCSGRVLTMLALHSDSLQQRKASIHTCTLPFTSQGRLCACHSIYENHLLLTDQSPLSFPLSCKMNQVDHIRGWGFQGFMGSALFSPGTFPVHFCNIYLTLIINRSKTQKSIKAQRVSLCPTDSKDIHNFPKSSTYANNYVCVWCRCACVCSMCISRCMCVDVRI